MTKPPDHPKAGMTRRKKRAGFDICVPVPKSLEFSDTAAAKRCFDQAKRYYDSDDQPSGQWYGKGAATLHQACGNRASAREAIPATFRHKDARAHPIEPSRQHLWVNGVGITEELAGRLHRMSEKEYEQFWEEALKGQTWIADLEGGEER